MYRATLRIATKKLTKIQKDQTISKVIKPLTFKLRYYQFHILSEIIRFRSANRKRNQSLRCGSADLFSECRGYHFLDMSIDNVPFDTQPVVKQNGICCFTSPNKPRGISPRGLADSLKKTPLYEELRLPQDLGF